MSKETSETLLGIFLFIAFCAFLYWANGGI